MLSTALPFPSSENVTHVLLIILETYTIFGIFGLALKTTSWGFEVWLHSMSLF